MRIIFNKYLSLIAITLFITLSIHAQRPENMTNERDGMGSEKDKTPTETIPPDVRTWKLKDHFTFSDTIPVDTLSDGYQIFNPVFRETIAANHLGNLGSSYQSMLFDEQQHYYGHLFYNSLLAYIPQPDKLYFFNTKTPYVNVSYHFGGPKRRSEEYISALYTQNITKKTNVGIQYQLSSSMGQYQVQKAENQNFKFWSSYNGDLYNMHMAFIYAKIANQENGGLNIPGSNDNFPNEDPEDLAFQFSDASLKLNNLQFFYNHSLSIGNINVKGKDSTVTELPVSTVYHTLKFDQGKRNYHINQYPKIPFYNNIYRDSLQTRDSTLYNNISNTFQIKFNEEANSLLKFGLRAYIVNDISLYKFPGNTGWKFDKDGKGIPVYQTRDTSLVTSAIGGQIFKNLGKNLWWNAGMKLYFQGYRAGDSEITGSLNSSFRIRKDTAGFFANGGIYLRQPELFENQYYSNHIQWSEDFNQVKSIRIHGGFRIPTKRFELSAGANIVTDHIYWYTDGTPRQSSKVIQILNARLKKHFQLRRVHCVNDAVVQYSSDNDIIPVPLLSLYNSTYYENTLFRVLHFQVGIDLRYNTAYYAPKYMPATSTFVNQKDVEVGNYPFIDVFANLQLKRARIYVKFDHVNQGYPDDPYYAAYKYPANPRSLKFGVSWNFYD